VWLFGGIRVGRIGGIVVEVHPTFALILGWAAWQGWRQYGSLGGVGYSLLSIVLLFACVLLHELGHGLQARALGLSVRGIMLLPTGGLVQLETSPSHPWHEVAVSLAGPMANLGLALILGIIAYATQPFYLQGWSNYLLFRATPGTASLLLYLVWANLLLFFFNMVPAFPMDGGRVIRGALAILLDLETATRLAAGLGYVAALILAAVGVLGWPPGSGASNLLLVLVAVVVYFGARQEVLEVRRRRALVCIEAGDVARAPDAVLSPWDAIAAGPAARLKGEQVLPVLVDGRLVGLLTAHALRHAAGYKGDLTVAHLMRSDFPHLGPHDALWVALHEMMAAQIDALPVMDEGEFVGLVSLREIKDAWRVRARRSRRRVEPTPVSGDTLK
jgi:Zn-dependent protease